MGEEYVHQGMENDQLFSASYDHKSGKTCRLCNLSKAVDRPPRKGAALCLVLARDKYDQDCGISI